MEAAAKKHEAIETDILAYEERVQAVVAVALELEAENYHDIDRINARKYYARLQLLLCECTKAHLCEHGHYISLCKCTMNFCVSTGSLDVEPVFILIGFRLKKALVSAGNRTQDPRSAVHVFTDLATRFMLKDLN